MVSREYARWVFDAKAFEAIVRKRNRSMRDVADATGIGHSSVLGYASGSRQPSIGYAKAIAEYLRVPLDLLVRRRVSADDAPRKVRRHSAEWDRLANSPLYDDSLI